MLVGVANMVSSFGKLYAKGIEMDFHTDESFRAWMTEKSRNNGTPGGGRKLVKQSLRDSTDINKLMARWEQHGMAIPSSGNEPVYGDFSDRRSYQECVDRVMAIGSDFMALPAQVRKACENDPGVFVEMCSNPDRLDELKKLGLVEERVPGAAERMLKVLEERLPRAVESSEKDD